jgi:D-glycero-D-manno-heptose 1,7-bisphosphate phosphatase
MTTPRPALFLDRDGVVNIDVQFLHRIEECRFSDGIFDVTAEFARRGFAIVIASNQSGIARGLYGEATFARLMDWMRGEFTRRGVGIDGVYFAPTHASDGVGPYRRESQWRKPAPGMFRQAASDLMLDLGRSVSVGNQPSDLDASRAAGIGGLFLYDPDAATVARHDDYWLVPRLADILAGS